MSLLPFAFDTTATPRLIVQGVAALLLVLALGLAVSLLVTRNLVAAAVLAISAGIAMFFARAVLSGLTATQGTVTSTAVDVRRGYAVGVPLAGPIGTFPIGSFRAVRYEEVSQSLHIFGPTGRVILVGAGAPDVLLARTGDEGRALARDLAAELRMPYEEAFVE